VALDPEQEPERGRDADRRRPAHRQAPDPVEHLLGRPDVEHDELPGQPRLVDHPDVPGPSAFPSNRRNRHPL
jgi:hypothetical protein